MRNVSALAKAAPIQVRGIGKGNTDKFSLPTEISAIEMRKTEKTRPGLAGDRRQLSGIRVTLVAK